MNCPRDGPLMLQTDSCKTWSQSASKRGKQNKSIVLYYYFIWFQRFFFPSVKFQFLYFLSTSLRTYLLNGVSHRWASGLEIFALKSKLSFFFLGISWWSQRGVLHPVPTGPEASITNQWLTFGSRSHWFQINLGRLVVIFNSEILKSVFLLQEGTFLESQRWFLIMIRMCLTYR